jgi:hypothetical protein
MFKSKKNKVDEIIKKLQKETTSEVLSNSKDICGSTIKEYMCTRPKGHSGYHVASSPGYFVAIWYHMLSD